MEQRRPDKLRILLSAYSCEAGRGSEPGVGWNIARELARDHEVIVLTQRAEQAKLLPTIEERGLSGSMQVVGHDLPEWMPPAAGGMLGSQYHYYLWQLSARSLVQRVVRSRGIALVHHVTFGRYWSPSCLAAAGVPFIWGPLGGGEQMPASFLPTLGPQGRLCEATRQLAQRASRHDPRWKATVRAASLALCSTPETAGRLCAAGCRRVQELLQMGIDPADAGVGATEVPLHRGRVRLISAGRLIPWKGVHLALAAFARMRIPCEYLIIGDGPQRSELEQQARAQGVADRVRFRGNIPRPEALKEIQEADILVHPSLHDQAPAAVFEGMLARKPVVCLGIGGPALQVGERAGFVIPAEHPDQVIEEMSQALTELASNADLRGRMGTVGRRRVLAEFTWERKVRQMAGLYREVLAEAETRQAARRAAGLIADAA